MYKVGDKVQYKHPFTNITLIGEVFEVHNETIISKHGVRNYTWYEMNTYGDIHHVGNHVEEYQIIRLCTNQAK